MWLVLLAATAWAEPSSLVGESTFQLFRTSLDRARLPASLPMSRWIDLHTQLSQRADNSWFGAGAVAPVGTRTGLMGFGAIDVTGSRARTGAEVLDHDRFLRWDVSLAWGRELGAGNWATGLRLTSEGTEIRQPGDDDDLTAVSGGELDPQRPIWFRTGRTHAIEGAFGMRRQRSDGWFDASLLVRWDRQLQAGHTDVDATGFVVEEGFAFVPYAESFGVDRGINQESVRIEAEFETVRGRGRDRGHRVGGSVGVTTGGVASKTSEARTSLPPDELGPVDTRTWTKDNELGVHASGFGIGEFRWPGLELRVGGILDVDLTRFRGDGSSELATDWSIRWDGGSSSLSVPVGLMAQVHPKVALISAARATLEARFLLWDGAPSGSYEWSSSSIDIRGDGRLGVRWTPLERLTLTTSARVGSVPSVNSVGGGLNPFGGAAAQNPFGLALVSTPSYSLSLMASVVVHLGNVKGRGPMSDLGATQRGTIAEVP